MVRQGTDFLDCLQVFRAGMQEEMNVRVDEAGQQGCVAEVDDLCTLRMLDGLADGANALALNQNFAGLEDDASIDLEQAGRVEDDGCGERLLGGS